MIDSIRTITLQASGATLFEVGGTCPTSVCVALMTERQAQISSCEPTTADAIITTTQATKPSDNDNVLLDRLPYQPMLTAG